MKAGRLLLVAVVVAAVVGLVVFLPGTSEPAPASLGRTPVPAAQADGALSLTWYCAASTALALSEPPAHTVLLTNPTADDVVVRATPFGPDGPGPAVEITVPPGAPTEIDVREQFGDPSRSVMVEAADGNVAVAHRLTLPTAADEVPCATSTSDQWWFPALATVRGTGAQLTLFNPFSGDAGVDVEVYLDAGVRLPTELNGIVVPAGTVRVVDLGQAVQRRDQFAVVVRLRSGRVVAEATQTYDGSTGFRGLRMNLGVPAPAERWAFAGGFSGEGVAEGLVLVNPEEEAVTALVQVTPYGAAATAPEPLEIEVPALRWVVVDLSAESRIPGVGYHSILVDSPDAPIVAARTTGISGPPAAAEAPAADGSATGDAVPVDASTRPALERGVAIGTGTPVAASDWIVPVLRPATDPAPVVLVHNPNDGIAVVTASVVGSDGAGDDVEVQPGDSVVLSVPAGDPGLAALVVSSMSPVVVEQLLSYPDVQDLAFGLAVPLRSDRRDLTRLGTG